MTLSTIQYLDTSLSISARHCIPCGSYDSHTVSASVSAIRLSLYKAEPHLSSRRNEKPSSRMSTPMAEHIRQSCPNLWNIGEEKAIDKAEWCLSSLRKPSWQLCDYIPGQATQMFRINCHSHDWYTPTCRTISQIARRLSTELVDTLQPQRDQINGTATLFFYCLDSCCNCYSKTSCSSCIRVNIIDLKSISYFWSFTSNLGRLCIECPSQLKSKKHDRLCLNLSVAVQTFKFFFFLLHDRHHW